MNQKKQLIRNHRHQNSSQPPSLSPQTTGTVFLQTAMIPILVNGETTLCRALLDSGSQSNLITENLVTRLGLLVKKQQVRIFCLGAKDELQHRGTTDFLITPKRAAAVPVRAFVMSKLTNISPSCKVSTSSFKRLPTSRSPIRHSTHLLESTCSLKLKFMKPSCWLRGSRKTTK